ncbi:MAG: YdjY domain-containing protein [Phycisphaerae bacterium]
MKRLTIMVALILSATCLCLGQEDQAANKPGTRPARGPVNVFKHVMVDMAERNVLVDAEVVMQKGIVEYFLSGKGKAHETVFLTDAKPSHLHASLLMLGLTPGIPAQWTGEGASGRFLPPRGPKVEIKVRWSDKKGKQHELPAGDFLKLTGKKGSSPPDRYIFVGSELFPDGTYLADEAGEHVSTANKGAAVMDVPFESSESKGQELFEADPEVVPAKGTDVKVVFHVPKGQEKAPHARVYLDIDRFGRLNIGGRPVTWDQLDDWAEKYLSQHQKGMVLIRPSPYALVYDISKAREELRLGGLFDTEVHFPGSMIEVLPRTPDQASAALKVWKQKFANPKEYLVDPAEEAEAALEALELEIRELEARKKMLQKYHEELKERATQFRKENPDSE